jgi:hypothetical protein
MNLVVDHDRIRVDIEPRYLLRDDVALLGSGSSCPVERAPELP